MSAETRKLRFTGTATEYFLLNLLWGLASVFTLGVLFPVWVFYSVRYFITHTEIEK